MSKSFIALILGMTLALPALSAEPAPAQTAAPVDATAAAGVDATSAPGQSNGEKIAESMTAFRDELQNLETEVVSKSVVFTADEASAFWPAFKNFQAEQRVIIDGQISAVRAYADGSGMMTDDDGVQYVNALLQRDQQVHDLRVKYLATYTNLIGKAKAARVIHISRKLGTVSQAKISGVIPLVQ